MIVRELVTKIGFRVDKKGADNASQSVDKVKQKLERAGETGKRAGDTAASGINRMGSEAGKSAGLIDRLTQRLGVLGRSRASAPSIAPLSISRLVPSGLFSALGMAGGIGAKSFSSMSGLAEAARGSVMGVTGAVGGLVSALGPLAAAVTAAFSVSAIKNTADEMMNLDSRLRNVTSSEQERFEVEEKLYSLAQNNRQSLQSIGDLYFKVARGAKQFGISQEDSLRVTDVVSKALTAGGASAMEAKASILQLGQAIGSGRLQGDELRSLDENASNLMQHIAEHFGVTVGQLKKLGAEGQLTSEKIIEGILASGAAVDSEFGNMQMTVDQSMQMIETAWDYTILRIQNKTQIFSSIAKSIASALHSVESGIDALFDLAAGPKSESEEDRANYSVLQEQHPVLSRMLDLWNQISEAIGGAGKALSRLGAALAPIIEKIGPKVSLFIGAVVKGLTFIINIFTAIIDKIAQFAEAFPGLTEAIMTAGAAIATFLVAPFLLVLAVIGTVVDAVAWIADAISNTFQSGTEAVSAFIDSFISGAQNAWTSFTGAASGAINSVKSFFSDLYNYAVGIIQSIADAIQSWIGSKIDWAIDSLNTLRDFASSVSDGIANSVTNAQTNMSQTNTFYVGSPEEAGQVLGYQGVTFFDNV